MILSDSGQWVTLLHFDWEWGNAYMGADAMVKALHDGADIIIAGRVSDPSLFLAPMMYS
ncbi:acyclic terpene utilization AtuA family protein [Symbiopectobacterium purcellii]|uniref:acyclic terpene utilization AtuA family protein n=1 Tax=Symbiopectobacterium purcellii TaxID=2871826 RepID=UPI003F869035